MDEQLRQTVRERADHRCEYCYLMPNPELFFAYLVEHIVARQHGGTDDSEIPDSCQRPSAGAPMMS